MKLAILGTGHVGQALAKGLSKTRHEVTFGSRDPSKADVPPGTKVETMRRAAAWAEAAILAVPYSALKDTIEAAGLGNLKGKTVIDPTNVLSPSGELALGFTTSGAEELAKLVPDASVVKAFNTIFAQNMASGRLAGQPLTLPVAGDDPKAKAVVMALGRDIGFEPVDAGPLKAARYLEPMGMHLISLGYGQRMGTAIGYRLVRGRG
ncbi:MAG TPA: NAD(P)-binding domain-containing protein [Thermoplasmata archaeon]|nr:NAD(P)-binding domain-containing protein [Thermoplasmata archaeon]